MEPILTETSRSRFSRPSCTVITSHGGVQTSMTSSSTRDTGQLIRELTLDPTRDYQPRGLPPGPPPGTLCRPPAAAPDHGPTAAPAAGVKAGRRPPAGQRP